MKAIDNKVFLKKIKVAKRLLGISFFILIFSVTPAPAFFSNEFEIGIHNNQPAIIMNGVAVNRDTAISFKKIIEDNPEVKTVVFGDSIGGRSSAAMYVGALIRINGLNTTVVGGCESACALMWLGGVQREIEKGGYLGYHPTTHFIDPLGFIPTFGEATEYVRNKDQEYFKVMTIPKEHMDAYNKGWFGLTSKVYSVAENQTSDLKCEQREVQDVDPSKVSYRCIN